MPGIIILFATAACGEPEGTQGDIPFDIDLRSYSVTAMDRLGDGIGYIQRSIFLADGSRVLVLDRHEPHLRLFTVDGDLLWTGAPQGEGPGEMSFTGFFGTAMADMGERVMTLHRGRATFWTFQGDSLMIEGTTRFSPFVAPSDIVDGCGGEWVLYGRDERGLGVPPIEDRWFTFDVGETGFLHTLSVTSDSLGIHTQWWDSPGSIGVSTAYLGRGLSRHGDRIVLHHRPMSEAAGEFLEFECDGTQIRRTEETPLIRGDTLNVKAPRDTPPPAPTGAVAIKNGFLVILRRNFVPSLHGVTEGRSHSEFMTVLDGRLVSAALAWGRWSIQDYHPSIGVLLGSNDSIPHFIVVPPDKLRAH